LGGAVPISLGLFLDEAAPAPPARVPATA
jgi:hypothetical protein